MPPRPVRSSNAFARSFETAFQASTALLDKGEVRLFTALRDTLRTQAASRFDVEIFHGWHHQVCFEHEECHWRETARCELSDLMIVTYDDASDDIRLCFLQAKFESDNKLVPTFTYAANLEQWILLARRPLIKGVGRFAPPPTLLSSASHESVGAFGFFHRLPSNPFELRYRAAPQLSSVGNYTQRHGRLTTLCADQLEGDCDDECVGADSAYEFAQALHEVRIGTPVLRLPKEARAWLAGVLTRATGTTRRDWPLSQEVLRRLVTATPSAPHRGARAVTPEVVVIRGSSARARPEPWQRG